MCQPELWKPREGLSRRFELRKKSDVEELAARDVDTTTAGINAQARRLQRIRAKGTPALTSETAQSSPPTGLRRTVSETSLSPTPTLPEAAQRPEEPLPDSMRYSLYQCPHLLLLQGYNQQHVSHPQPPAPLPLTAQGVGGQASSFLPTEAAVGSP